MTGTDPTGEQARIGEVALRVDLDPDTIRYYERQGVLPQPQRDPEGVPDRLALLQEHRAEVRHRIATWTRSLRVIEQKIVDYEARVDSGTS